MGGLLSSCVGSCAGACAIGTCCSLAKVKGNRIPYLVLFFICLVIASILRYWGGPLLIHLYVYDWNICTTDKCYGVGAVYRVCMGLLFFFLFMAALSLAKSCARHDAGHFLLKTAMLIGFIVASFFIPNEAINPFIFVFQFFGGLFLIIQIILLIDFAYSWNQDWMSDEKGWAVPVLGVSAVFYLSSLAALIVFFVEFGRDEACSENKTFISLTLISSVIYSLLSVTEWCEHGALLPSSIITLYSYWILWSVLTDGKDECNPFQSDSPVQVVIGFVLGAASVTYAGWNLSNKTESLIADQVSPEASLMDNATGAANYSGVTEEKADIEADVEEEEAMPATDPNQSLKFHLVMAGASCYAAMLLTSWGFTTEGEYNSSSSRWIKILSQWMTIILYFWSLVAPYACPGRNFD